MLFGNVINFKRLQKKIKSEKNKNNPFVISPFYSIIGILLYRLETVIAERIQAAERACNIVLRDLKVGKEEEGLVDTFCKLFQSYKNTFFFYKPSLFVFNREEQEFEKIVKTIKALSKKSASNVLE